MRLLWLHKPHPCKTCGVTLHIAYPTCATQACRVAWRKKSWLAAQQARRDATVAAHRCARCKKQLPQESKSYRCEACKKKHRHEMHAQREEEKFRAYQQELAFARAEREIARKEAAQAAARLAEQERIHREARESASRGWITEEGEPMYEEV